MEHLISDMCLKPFYCKGQYCVCGHCKECRARRVSNWSFRLMQEAKVSETSYFVTLTYNNEHLPSARCGKPSLRAGDLQLYFKRLRKLCVGGLWPVKYYAVGEYGGRFRRPHYHAIIFNAGRDSIVSAWSKDGVELGNVFIGYDCGEAAVGYTLKYIMKGSWRPQDMNDDREPHFSRMSKGLGISYGTERMIAWHMADLENRWCCVLRDGRRVAMPRYYKEKFFGDEEKEFVRLHVRPKIVSPDMFIDARSKSEMYWFDRELISKKRYLEYVQDAV